MPLKKGGGNHLQFYDGADGQYDDEEKARINEEDKKALSLVHYFGLSFNELVFHFPTFGLHDDEYCRLFVQFSRKAVKRFKVDEMKIVYLLKPRERDDKSKFLHALGYSIDGVEELRADIHCGTTIDTLMFKEFSKFGIKCEAKTVLKGKIVTTAWMLENDFTIRLITLIPGGDKKWKR